MPRLIKFSAVALLVALTAGCSGGGPTTLPDTQPESSPSKTTTATPDPDETPVPVPLPDNALFRITAVATGSNGAIVDLVETVYQPVTPTAADTAKLLAECTEGNLTANYPNMAVMYGEASWTLRAGSVDWVDYSPMGVGLIMSNYSVWTGSFVYPEFTGCGGATPAIVPSTAVGIAPLSPASDPVGVSGGHGWYNGVYGFQVTYDGDASNDTPIEQTVFISDCALELSDAAKAAHPLVAAWPSQTQPSTYTCTFAPVD